MTNQNDSALRLPSKALAAKTPLLEVADLHAWYGAAHILHGVSLSVGHGEVVALMGRNGAGKSTTLKTLMGLMDKRKGTVRFMQRDISARQPYQIAALGMGFVPEDRRVFVDLTVTENLEVAARRHAAGPTARPRRRGRRKSSTSCFPTWARCPIAPAGA